MKSFIKNFTNQTQKFSFEKFLKHPEHHWIINSRRHQRVFKELIALIPKPRLDKISERGELVFIKISNQLACSLGAPIKENIILIYPDLIEMMNKFDYSESMAILAHEIGHLYFQHSQRKIDPLKAQIEADFFCSSIGLKDELCTFLKKCPLTLEIKIRLEHLEISESI